MAMKKSLLLTIVGFIALFSLTNRDPVECPSLECLDRGCRLAETAQKLRIPTENWPEFARQFGAGEFCGELACCCADHAP